MKFAATTGALDAVTGASDATATALWGTILLAGTLESSSSETGLYPNGELTHDSSMFKSYFSAEKDNAAREANEDETSHTFVAVITDTDGSTPNYFSSAWTADFSLGAVAGFTASAVAVAAALSF